MKIQISSPKTKDELKKYYFLRWKILRKPFNKSLGSEKDEFENQSFHLFIKNESLDIIAVGRLNFVNDKKDAHIRYMAVDHDFQKKGYGSEILKKLEKFASNNKVNNIYLHSRESALVFYEKNGYKIEKKSHLLFNEIQHWFMKKKLI